MQKHTKILRLRGLVAGVRRKVPAESCGIVRVKEGAWAASSKIRLRGGATSFAGFQMHLNNVFVNLTDQLKPPLVEILIDCAYFSHSGTLFSASTTSLTF